MINHEDVFDAINAFTIYKSSEAGVFGETEYDAVQSGVLGGVATDTENATRQFLQGEINAETAKERVKESFLTGARVMAKVALSKGVDFLAEFARTQLPTFSPVIIAGANFIKATVIPKVTEIGEQVIRKVGAAVKRFVSSLFS